MPIYYLSVSKKLKFPLEEENTVQNPYIFFFFHIQYLTTNSKNLPGILKKEQLTGNQEEKDDKRNRSKGIQLPESLGIAMKTDEKRENSYQRAGTYKKTKQKTQQMDILKPKNTD